MKISNESLPKHMRGLPRDHRGFPVPWFVEWIDGEPHFPIASAEKMARAVRHDLCWVCGGVLGRFRASVIGPMCAITRTISDPQSHVACARFAAKHCPFLANPRMKRVPLGKLPGGIQDAPGNGIKRNPGACAVWIETTRTKPFRAGHGYLFKLGNPHLVEWYAEGRTASRNEIEHSITSGLPLLFDECDREPTDARRAAARAELDRRIAATMRLVQTSIAPVACE